MGMKVSAVCSAPGYLADSKCSVNILTAEMALQVDLANLHNAS